MDLYTDKGETTMQDTSPKNETPSDIRLAIRSGEVTSVTSGLAEGYVQANVVILPKALSFDFLLFCQRNPKPCPILEVIEAGQFDPHLTCSDADIRYDVPLYNIYRDGILSETCRSIEHVWSDDLVSFLIGCSFSFENALKQANIPLRHQEMECNVPMYKTSIPTVTAGIFSGPLVVSMRPVKRSHISKAVQVTSRFPDTHGAPIHIGSPNTIGITDLGTPDYGEPVRIFDDEEPVFWACGVTPQAAAIVSHPNLMITHAPGHMLITDKTDNDFSIF